MDCYENWFAFGLYNKGITGGSGAGMGGSKYKEGFLGDGCGQGAGFYSWENCFGNGRSICVDNVFIVADL